MKNWLKHWWTQVDHYDWIMAYLRTRGIDGLIRGLISAICLSASVVALLIMSTPQGANGELARAASGVASVGLLLGGLLWAARLPTRRQSMVFSVGITACIAAIASSCSDPGLGLGVCTTFALIAAYIAFSHTAVCSIINFQVALGVSAFEAFRFGTDTFWRGADGRWALAVGGLWMLVVLIVSAPAAVQTIVHSLGTDLLRADSDPLTYTLNRRAFTIKAQELVSVGRGPDAYLMVMVIDLDDFKLLNDASGHSVGDRALKAVAEILQAQTRETAVIGRVGGDEFLIADASYRAHHTSLAERLRSAIAAMHYPITASIGVAATSISDVEDAEVRSTIDDLTHAADQLMYDAKRAGGNRIRHTMIDATA